MSESNIDEIKTQLTSIIDREEVKAIAHRFARGLDRCDRSIIESCFHSEGIDDHGFFKGNAKEFCDWVMVELKKYDASQHLIATQNVEVSGVIAVCESYFTAIHIIPNPEGPAKEVIVAGRYIDEAEKRDGVWKLTYRKCVFDWNRMRDSAPLPSRDPEPRHLGKQFPDDDSYAAFAKLL